MATPPPPENEIPEALAFRRVSPIHWRSHHSFTNVTSAERWMWVIDSKWPRKNVRLEVVLHEGRYYVQAEWQG